MRLESENFKGNKTVTSTMKLCGEIEKLQALDGVFGVLMATEFE